MSSESEEQTTGSLVTMVNETSKTLTKIWDEIGFSDPERQAQLQALEEQVRQLCDEKVIDEEAVRDTFKSSIEENKTKATEAAKRLGLPSPNVETDEDGLEIATQALTSQLAFFEQLTTKLEIQVCAKESQVSTVHESVLSICQELGLDAEEVWKSCGGDSNGKSEDLSDTAILRFNAKQEELITQKSARIDEMTEVVTQCQGLLVELGMNADSPLELQIKKSLDLTGQLTSYLPSETCVGISTSMLQQVFARTNELVEERDKRSAYLLELGEQISVLWDLLSISEEDQLAIEESLAANGLSTATIQLGEKELARLEALKKIKMVELINGRRARIEELWNQTSATQEQRSSFKEFYNSNESAFSDDSLQLHDAEVATLETRLETMQPLIKLIQKYEEAVRLRSELEELQKDKDRLKGKGSRLVLKTEEEMAKKIKQLPKIVDSLTKLVKEWETREGVEFTMKDSTGMGQRCMDVVTETEESWSKKKEEAAANKKAKRPSSSGNGLSGSDMPVKHIKRPSKVPFGDASARNNA